MRAALVAVFLLAGCTSGVGPLEKPAPEIVTEQSLVRPPWQALVKAGPDAAKDIDLETLDGSQAPVTQVAASATEVQPPQSAPRPTDPNATEIKSVSVMSVSGASVQGNRELSAAMAKVLKGAGWPLAKKASKNALAISANVTLDAASGANQMVHIIWTVTSPKGRVLGTVGQNNPVPGHTLDGAWGANASAAAEAAAEGIFRLIAQYR